MKKLQVCIGLVMGTALFAGCTNTAQQQHFFPPTPDYVEPSPAPAPPAIENVNHVETDEEQHWTPAPPAPAQEAEDPLLFAKYRGLIVDAASTVSVGSASAVRFMNYTTNKRYTTMAMSDDGMVPVDGFPGAGLTFLTNEQGERLAIIVSSLKPGHYTCGASGFAIGFAFPNEAIDSEEASWSDRDGGSCEFDLWEGNNPGDIQGSFGGMLATNEGHTLSIADGYFYLRSPRVTPAPFVGATPRPAAPRHYHR